MKLKTLFASSIIIYTLIVIAGTLLLIEEQGFVIMDALTLAYCAGVFWLAYEYLTTRNTPQK